MPIVDRSSSTLSTDSATFEDVDSATLLGLLTLSNPVALSDVDETVMLGTVSYAGTAVFEDVDDDVFQGYKNNEANVFGSMLVEDSDSFVAAAIARYTGIALFEDVEEAYMAGVLSVAETPRLTFVIDVVDDEDTLREARRKVWLPRLRVDGAEVRVLRASLADGEDSAGKTVDVTLASQDDWQLFTDLASIDFGYGRRTGGAWDETTMEWELLDGQADGRRTTTAGEPDSPQDSVSITIHDRTKTNLLKTALRPLIIYDSDRTSVDTSQMDVLRDSAGRTYPTEAKAIPGMKLFDLLDEILVNRCGFADYDKNLPNYPILRYECQIGQPLYDGLKKFIGQFTPATPTVDGILWIKDTTLVAPDDFPAPREVSFDQVKTLDDEDSVQKIDGYLVDYVETDNAYDYTTFRFEDGSLPAGATRTDFNRIYIEFRKLAHPDIVLREALNIEERSVYSSGVLIEQSTENWIYDGSGNIASRRKTVDKRVPDLSLPAYDLILQREREEYEEYVYMTNPFRIYEKYIASRKMAVTGRVTKDTDNPQLNRPFFSPISSSFRSGNLAAGMLVITDTPLLAYSETAEPLRDGTVRVRVHEVDQVADVVTKDYTEVRPGAIGTRAAGAIQKQVLVFAEDNSARSLDRIEPRHAGELPLTLALPLFRRQLVKENSKNDKIRGQLIGYDKTIRKGMPIGVKAYRKASAPTSALVIGRQIESDANGTFMTITSKAI